MREAREYVERGKLLHEMEMDIRPPFAVVRDFPAADVAQVMHGRWIGKPLDNFRKYQVTCSNCKWVGIENYDSYNDPSEFNYCPNCGAKMDGDDDFCDYGERGEDK